MKLIEILSTIVIDGQNQAYDIVRRTATEKDVSKRHLQSIKWAASRLREWIVSVDDDCEGQDFFEAIDSEMVDIIKGKKDEESEN